VSAWEDTFTDQLGADIFIDQRQVARTWLDSRGVEVDSSPESLRSGPQEAEIP
jgi:hypothetical protein